MSKNALLFHLEGFYQLPKDVMKELYQVDEFYPSKSGNHRFEK